ncbi:unnamed protein product [Pocillopora meandrina]|uniref:SSD domain-containing protein n=1 Tax=Pocillopora meandrina TaxID=46732 RepID=A0AAU9Y429_9CNID|nr:unnamed protein product [Pocillopora meandrina]
MCLKQAFRAHDAVMELKSFSDLCVTLSGNKSRSTNGCAMINPLEFLQFNESNLNGKDLHDVQRELSKSYNDTSLLMRNGRPFWLNFNRMFGKATRKHGSITDAKALQMIYLLRDPRDDDESDKILKWEKAFIDKLGSLFGGVLPFLVLGIGIDDMFIMVDELDRQPRDLSTTGKIKAVMKHSGATVTMTTMTDLVAFAVSTSTSFPAIRYFCVYAALTVTLSFLMVVTFFVALMTYDVRRIKSGRRDFLPFCLAPRPKEGKPAWDEPLPQTSNKVMKYWGTLLTLPITKVLVILFSLSLLGAGIYGVTQVDESFDRRVLARDDSYLRQFLTAQGKYFELSIGVSIVQTGEVDYQLRSTQSDIKELTNVFKENEYYKNQSLSWMDAFSQYAKKSKRNITGPGFLRELKTFLRIPEFSYFTQDVKLSEDETKIEASRVVGYMKDSGSSTFQKNAMLTLREDISKKSKLNAFPITRSFIFF